MKKILFFVLTIFITVPVFAGNKNHSPPLSLIETLVNKCINPDGNREIKSFKRKENVDLFGNKYTFNKITEAQRLNGIEYRDLYQWDYIYRDYRGAWTNGFFDTIVIIKNNILSTCPRCDEDNNGFRPGISTSCWYTVNMNDPNAEIIDEDVVIKNKKAAEALEESKNYEIQNKCFDKFSIASREKGLLDERGGIINHNEYGHEMEKFMIECKSHLGWTPPIKKYW